MKAAKAFAILLGGPTLGLVLGLIVGALLLPQFRRQRTTCCARRWLPDNRLHVGFSFDFGAPLDWDSSSRTTSKAPHQRSKLNFFTATILLLASNPVAPNRALPLE